MSPILNGLGGISVRGLGHFGPDRDTGAMFPISTAYLGSAGATSITFSSIPSTYKHLQIRMFARDNRSGDTVSSFGVRFNADTGNNYSFHGWRGDGSIITTGDQGTGQSSMQVDRSVAGNTADTNNFAAILISIPNYASTSQNKSILTLGGIENSSGGTGFADMYSGNWVNTSAVTSITIFSTYATFQQHSRFLLLGIKG